MALLFWPFAYSALVLFAGIQPAMTPGRIRIGLSGWRYRHWRGTFYPPGLQQRRELEFVAGIFPSVEINGTFYSLQRPASFTRWAAESPEDFLFALKGGRFITHMRKLLNVETALANFFASGPLALGHKLGPILWQLPPQLRSTIPTVSPPSSSSSPALRELPAASLRNATNACSPLAGPS